MSKKITFDKISNVIKKYGIFGFIMRVFKEILRRSEIKMSFILKNFYINWFHRLYYYLGDSRMGTWSQTYWLGVPVLKAPTDLWTYQEIIWETKPDLIVEAGTAFGGSAYFFASIFDLLGRGEVITIDIKEREMPKHPRIRYLIGSSVSNEIFDEVKKLTEGKKVMVVLDSNHSKQHVLKELELYSNIVSVGCYLIVEDTNINGHPVRPEFGPGPMEAVEEFLRKHKNFVIDKNREKFLLTFNPNGYLRRIK